MKIISVPRFQTSNVEREFLKSISRAFSKVGENKAHLAFAKFERDYDLSKSEIFDRPELFSNTLRNIFRFGSSYIEKEMISELCDEFRLPKRDYKSLADVVHEIKTPRDSAS